jgi:hypothetical protein
MMPDCFSRCGLVGLKTYMNFFCFPALMTVSGSDCCQNWVCLKHQPAKHPFSLLFQSIQVIKSANMKVANKELRHCPAWFCASLLLSGPVGFPYLFRCKKLLSCREGVWPSCSKGNIRRPFCCPRLWPHFRGRVAEPYHAV